MVSSHLNYCNRILKVGPVSPEVLPLEVEVKLLTMMEANYHRIECSSHRWLVPVEMIHFF